MAGSDHPDRTLQHETRDAADLYWLAYLLTGRHEISIDIVVETSASPDFFAGWMRAWSRRIVISKALGSIRAELQESARRTEQARFKQSGAPNPEWSPIAHTTKSRIEKALLAMDLFPRAAVLLSFFENVPIADLVPLLDADARLIRKAQAIGLRELTANLSGNQVVRKLSFAWMLA